MFDRLTWRAKFLIPLSILVVILLFFAWQLIDHHYQRKQSFHTLHYHIDLIHQFSQLLDAIQKERGITVGYLMTGTSGRFKQKLATQRRATDQAVQTTLAAKAGRNKLRQRIVLHLQALRECSNRASCDEEFIIREYSRINRLLTDRIGRLIDYSTVPSITQNMLVFFHLTLFKEYRGIERAQGTSIFASKYIDTETLLRFNSTVAAAKAHEALFATYADRQLQGRYRRDVLDAYSFHQSEILRQAIADRNQSLLRHTDPFKWFQVMTHYLDKVQQVLIDLEHTIQSDIRQRLKNEEKNFVFITSLTLFSLFVFFLMVLAFLRLYKEEQKYRTYFEKYIISSVTDTKGRIIKASQAFCDISGYEEYELIGKPHHIVRHPDTPKETFREMWTNLKQGKPWSGKLKNRRKDGSFYWVYAHIEPIFDKHGNIDSYIAIRLDITESELLQEQIRQKERENKVAHEMMLHQSRLAQMGELLNMIAHQWRQPLNVISLKAGVLQRKLQRNQCDPQTVEDTLTSITNMTDHLSQTIVSFRNFFKPDKEKKHTDFATIVNGIHSIVDFSLEDKGIRFETSIDDDATFLCYENELMQVLLNIVKNAEDAIEEHRIQNGHIRLHVRDFIVTIEDNAGGIPEEYIAKIFDPYFSTKTQKDGTGLGLYMSKIIIEEHCGGTLRAENKNGGACFTIDLSALKPINDNETKQKEA